MKCSTLKYTSRKLVIVVKFPVSLSLSFFSVQSAAAMYKEGEEALEAAQTLQAELSEQAEALQNQLEHIQEREMQLASVSSLIPSKPSHTLSLLSARFGHVASVFLLRRGWLLLKSVESSKQSLLPLPLCVLLSLF